MNKIWKSSSSVALLRAFFWGIPTFAYLPRAAITTETLKVYAVYTTTDATCQTGLVATVPMTATPVSVDFTKAIDAGAVSVSSPINCIIMVVANSVTVGWAAGTYTGQSSWSSGAVNLNDSAFCAAASAAAATPICPATWSPRTVNWPAAVQTDLTAKGLGTGITATTGALTEILPLYLSTNSKCTAQYNTDQSITGCSTYNTSFGTPGNNPHMAPTAANDTVHGINLAGSVASTSTNFKFVVDPSNSFGNIGGSCAIGGYPLFGFAAK